MSGTASQPMTSRLPNPKEVKHLIKLKYMMPKMNLYKTIAFDVKGTLTENGLARTEIVEILKALKRKGHTIIVWSGESQQYVENVVAELGISEYVDICASKLDLMSENLPERPDIAFDDQPGVYLAKEATILI